MELVKQDYEENIKQYQGLEKKLKELLGDSIPIDHVGSTAIPKMKYGKNIIDILIGAKDTIQFDKIKQIFEREGYVASQKSKDNIYQFFSSTAEETRAGDVHIHLVILDTDRYQEFLILKKYLLSHEEEVKKYSEVKEMILFQEQEIDRKTYKRKKSEYVSQLLIRAKKWSHDQE